MESRRRLEVKMEGSCDEEIQEEGTEGNVSTAERVCPIKGPSKMGKHQGARGIRG